MMTQDELRTMYGSDAVISTAGAFTLVHLDSPSNETLVRRTTEFDPQEFFADDCPVCKFVRDSGIVVFDDSIYEDEEIEL